MAQTSAVLQATARPRAGKGAARQVRREGKIPAVIYGAGDPPETIALETKALSKEISTGHFTSTVFEVQIDGDKDKRLVIPRDVQYHPVNDRPLHVDLLRIGKDGMIRVEVPVKFLNEGQSPGLKRGGALNIVRHEIEVFCPYDKIPSAFEIDLAGTEIGVSIHVSTLTMPDGVTLTITDRDFTIATIAGRLKEEEPAAAEGVEAEAAEGEAAAAGEGEEKKEEGEG